MEADSRDKIVSSLLLHRRAPSQRKAGIKGTIKTVQKDKSLTLPNYKKHGHFKTRVCNFWQNWRTKLTGVSGHL